MIVCACECVCMCDDYFHFFCSSRLCECSCICVVSWKERCRILPCSIHFILLTEFKSEPNGK